jgi:transposase
MALCTVRSDRLSCERLDYNLLVRWFLDLSRKRQRLLKHAVADHFLPAVVEQARALEPLSGLLRD